MEHPRPDNPEAALGGLNMRAFLIREWPYLLVLILALFGVAYTSFSKTPITIYWIILAPCIGVICVITRWLDAESREQRLRLIWTQALHWAAVLVAMHLMFVADVSRMMNADASALAALTILALGTLPPGSISRPGAFVWSGSCWHLESRPSHGWSNRHCFSCWLSSLSWQPVPHFSGIPSEQANLNPCDRADD